MENITSLFESLITNNEVRKIDFKRDQYLLTTEHLRSEFIKDILCMANAPGNDGHIVLGVKAEKGNPKEIIGILNHYDYDGSDLEQLVNGVIEEPIQFEYYQITYNKKECALIEIPKSKAKPHWPKKDYGVLKKHVFYTRRGPANREASKQEIRTMVIETMNISDIAQEKISKSLNIIDELKDYSVSQRFEEMHKMLKKISPVLGMEDYEKIINPNYSRKIQICALFGITGIIPGEFIAFMYPWSVKGQLILNARYEIQKLYNDTKNYHHRKEIDSHNQSRLKQSDLIHIAYGKIYISSLESRYMFSEYRFNNQLDKPWGKVIIWENTHNKSKVNHAIIYEFFLSKVISKDDMQNRLEKLFLWVKNNRP